MLYAHGEDSEKYSEWEVALAPFTKVSGFDKHYYEMAKNLCGEEIAKHSWLVKLHFPKWEPLASPANGIIYVAKNKEKGWFVWYRYR
jgi:hypothetical protein